jgi:hypothetical protein
MRGDLPGAGDHDRGRSAEERRTRPQRHSGADIEPMSRSDSSIITACSSMTRRSFVS